MKLVTMSYFFVAHCANNSSLQLTWKSSSLIHYLLLSEGGVKKVLASKPRFQLPTPHPEYFWKLPIKHSKNEPFSLKFRMIMNFRVRVQACTGYHLDKAYVVCHGCHTVSPYILLFFQLKIKIFLTAPSDLSPAKSNEVWQDRVWSVQIVIPLFL